MNKTAVNICKAFDVWSNIFQADDVLLFFAVVGGDADGAVPGVGAIGEDGDDNGVSNNKV